MAAVAIALACPSPGSAQTAVASAVVARAGEVVRVRTAGWEYTGTLAHVVNDTAAVRFGGDSIRLARPDVLRLDVQRGTRRSPARIALMAIGGGAAGSILGGSLGLFFECGHSCSDDGAYAGIGGAVTGSTLGFLAGAIGGGIWGAKKRYPRWMRAVLP